MTDIVAAGSSYLTSRAMKWLLEHNPGAWRDAIRDSLLDGLHEKQRAVLDDIAAGHRHIAMCTSRRAGKTTAIAVQIVLSLLYAGHNQTVLFVAPTLGKGKDLIFSELVRLIREYSLPWAHKEHFGSINTPTGARFTILGLSAKGKAESPRGADVIAAFVDEVQDSTHLLSPLLTAVGPALVGRGGFIVLSGTPGYQPTGTWHDIAVKGAGGFRTHHFTILDNTKLQRDPAIILEEELARNNWTNETPEFLREYKGLWVPDDSTMVFSFDSEKHSILTLPDDYGSRWDHVMAVDLGYNDHSAWCVVALDRDTQRSIILHAETHPRIFSDQAMGITRRLISEYSLNRVVCDPAAGGLQFYEMFNKQHGRELGVSIRGANKVNKKGRVAHVNSELRAGRLKVMRPNADVLAMEFQTLRYRNRDTCEFITSGTIRDDASDCAMYAMAELMPITSRPSPAKPEPVDRLIALFDQRNNGRDYVSDALLGRSR